MYAAFPVLILLLPVHISNINFCFFCASATKLICPPDQEFFLQNFYFILFYFFVNPCGCGSHPPNIVSIFHVVLYFCWVSIHYVGVSYIINIFRSNSIFKCNCYVCCRNLRRRGKRELRQLTRERSSWQNWELKRRKLLKRSSAPNLTSLLQSSIEILTFL